MFPHNARPTPEAMLFCAPNGMSVVIGMSVGLAGLVRRPIDKCHKPCLS
jgi:hypothetical protein